MTPTKEEAKKLFETYNKSESLTKHAIAVAAVMEHFAIRYGEDPEKWGIIGLLHDLDYEQFPEVHCHKTKEIMEEGGWPTDYIRAIMSHGWGICTDVQPEHIMEKVLYATDELTGLVVTSVLVRPDKDLHQLKVKSVMKKWKDKRFAAGVNRAIIQAGADMLGMERQELIEETIAAMKKVAGELGLQPAN